MMTMMMMMMKSPMDHDAQLTSMGNGDPGFGL